MLTAKDTTGADFSLILSGLADLPLVMAFLFVGMLLWAFYQSPGRTPPSLTTSSTNFRQELEES